MRKNYLRRILSVLQLVAVSCVVQAQIITQTITNLNWIQSYTVPYSCGAITIQAVGASGGAVSNCSPTVPGGRGANMKGTFSFTPGTVLLILAGSIGQSSGGDGGGGGGSFVALAQGTVPVIVAGGGGGSSSQVNNCTASLVLGMDASLTTSGTASRNGFAAGGTNGQGGALGGTVVSSGGSGGGFYGDGAYFVNPTAGGKAFVNGGAGGTPNTVSTAGGFGGGGCSWSVGGGGGGGGGYSGGASWQQNPYCGGGGGGSYNSGSNQVNAVNTSSGNGYVLITFDAGTPITTSASATLICEGESVNLGASGTGLISYTWSTGPTQASITVSPAVTSSFVIAATDASNCVSRDTVFIQVNPLPVIVSTTTPALLCVGNSATMTVNGAPTFTWNGGPESNEYVVSPVVTTVYSVSGTSPEGCVTEKTVAVNVNTNTMGVSPNSTICAGKGVTLTATGANTYLWNTSPQSPFNPIVLNPTLTTMYIVDGVDAFGCQLSNTVVVTVEPKPPIGLTASDTHACTGDMVVLTATGGSTYVFGSPVGGSGNTGTIIPTINIAQTYSVTGTSPAGCTNTAQITIQVSRCDDITEHKLSAAHVYPNPGNGVFTVEMYGASTAGKLTVYDISGRLVVSIDGASQTILDLRGQPQGIYILYCDDSIGRRQVARLIKE